jgi:hypothetical protein
LRPWNWAQHTITVPTQPAHPAISFSAHVSHQVTTLTGAATAVRPARPGFPRRLFVDRHPRSHAAHHHRAHGLSLPTVSPHVRRMSDVDHATNFIHAHHFPADAHRSHRHGHVRASSLSPLSDRRSQAGFLLSAPCRITHHISHVLRCPVHCASLPSSRWVKRHQVVVLLRRPCRRPELHPRASRCTAWSGQSPTVRH